MAGGFSKDGGKIFTLDSDFEVRIWDSTTFNHHLLDAANLFRSAEFSADGRKVVTTDWSTRDPCTVKIWDCSNGELLHKLYGHKHEVCSATFSADGSKVLSGSVDAKAIIWEIRTGRRLKIFSGHTASIGIARFI